MAKKDETNTAEANETQAIPVNIGMAELKELLKAEILKEIKAEEEAKTPPPARAAKKDPYLNELVPVQLFKDGKDYKADVSVHVNGENCVIKRGEPVMIKRKFALVLDQSAKQNIKAAEFSEQKQQEYKEQLRKYNI